MGKERQSLDFLEMPLTSPEPREKTSFIQLLFSAKENGVPFWATWVALDRKGPSTFVWVKACFSSWLFESPQQEFSELTQGLCNKDFILREQPFPQLGLG